MVNAGGMYAPEIGRLAGDHAADHPDGAPVPAHGPDRRASSRACPSCATRTTSSTSARRSAACAWAATSATRCPGRSTAIPADFNHRLLDPDWPRFERDHGRRRPPRPRDRGRAGHADDQRPRGRSPPTTSSSSASPRCAACSSPPASAPTASPAPAGSGASGVVDRRRRARARPVEDGHPPLRARSTGQPLVHARPEPSRTTRPTTTSTTRTRSATPAGRSACRRPTRGSRPSAPPSARSPSWERANWFEPNADGAGMPTRPSSRRSGRAAGPGEHWSPAIGAEALATRTTAALFDETSFAKIEVAGRARCGAPPVAVRERRRPARSARITYTQLLNRRGGIECDLTVTRLARGPVPARHRHGVRQPRPRLDPAPRAARRLGRDRRRDLGPGLLRRCGARAPATSSPPTTTDDLSDAAFPYLTARRDHRRHVPVYALRVTYVGELGWELYAHAEYGGALWDALWAAGRGARPRRRRLPRDRRAAAREGLPRLGGRHHARGDAVRGRASGFAVAPRQGRLPRARRARRREGGGPAEAAAVPRARRPALGLPRQRAGAGRRRRRRPGHLRRLRLQRRAQHRLRLPAARRADRHARRGRRVRDVGRASRSPASRCSTRRARGSAPEQGIIGAMTDARPLRPRVVRRPRARPRGASCASGSRFALGACDAADAIARDALPARPRPRAQAGPDVRDRRRPGDRARDPVPDPRPLAGPRAGRRGVRRGRRPRPRPAGSSTRSTAPTTSSAACRCSGRCWRSSTTASCRSA